MKPQLSILVPVYNEEELLPRVVAELLETLPTLGMEFEILLLENGSVDRTLEIARELEAAHAPIVRAFHIETPDYGAAIRGGLELARGDFGSVFEIDFIDVEFVRHRLDQLKSEVDMVIGSKMHPDSQDSRPFARKLYSYLYNLLLYLLFDFRGRETHGLKIFRIAPLLEPARSCVTRGDTFTTEWVIRSQWAGARILEVPVSISEVRAPRISPIRRIPNAVRNLFWMTNAMALRGPLLRVGVWILCVSIALFALWRYGHAQGHRNFGPDEGIYTYVGWSWSQGYWPYRDSWDHKGPVVYATTMLRTLLLDTKPDGLGVQEIFLGLTAALLLAGIAYHLWGGLGGAVGLSLSIVLWTQRPPEFGHMSTPGSLLALFTTGSILGSLAATKLRSWWASTSMAVFGGLCAGLAVCTKPNTVAGPVLAAGIFWLGEPTLRARDRLRLSFAYVITFVTPILFFGGLFYHARALPALYDSYFGFNSIRGRLMLKESGIRHILRMSYNDLKDVGVLPLAVAGLIGAGVVGIWHQLSRAKNHLASSRAEFIVLVWLAIELVILVLNGSYRHHVYTVIPPVALGATWLVMMARRISLLNIRAWSFVVFALILASPMLALVKMEAPQNRLHFRDDEFNRLVARLAAETDEQHPIFTFETGNGPSILSVLHRHNVSRYIYPMPMYARGYASDERWAEMIHEVEDRTQPEEIIINTAIIDPPPDGQKTMTWALSSFDHSDVNRRLVDRTRFPNRERLKDFITTHYRVEECASTLCLLRHLTTNETALSSAVTKR